MFKSGKDLIDDILSVKDSKHYHHLNSIPFKRKKPLL